MPRQQAGLEPQRQVGLEPRRRHPRRGSSARSLALPQPLVDLAAVGAAAAADLVGPHNNKCRRQVRAGSTWGTREGERKSKLSAGIGSGEYECAVVSIQEFLGANKTEQN